MALAVVLATAGGLMVRSAAALEAAPRGYEARGVVTASLVLPQSVTGDAGNTATLIDRLVTRLEQVPGVQGAAVASRLPFAGGSPGSDVALAGEAFTTGVDRQTRIRLTSPGYLRTLGVRVIEGRDLDVIDGSSARPAVVVNDTLARRLTPSGSPVGRDLRLAVPAFQGADGARVWHVVGVSGDTWDRGPRTAPEPELLMPIAQAPAEVFFWISRELQVAVRGVGDVQALVPAIRQAIAAVDPRLPVGVAVTVEERIATAFARERLLAQMLSAVGVAAVMLAMLGLVAIVRAQVQARRREIAVRLAIGARPSRVVGELVTRGVTLSVAGAAIGAVLSGATSRVMASSLFGVQAGDVPTTAVAALLVIVLSALAAWVPARRAATVDPARALRS